MRLIGALAVATASVVATPVATHASNSTGEVFMDCTRDGDEYVFLNPALGSGVTAWVTDDADVRVAEADVSYFLGYWLVTVPAGTDYATVWISDGTDTDSMTANSPDCTPNPVSVSTPNYGAGLTPISPQRLYDSRRSGYRLAAGASISVQASSRAGIPAGAQAIMVNLTAVAPSGPGHLTAYPCGSARPTASVLNYDAGETRAGASLVKLDSGGRVCVYSHAASDVIVDVQGYVGGAENPVAITPTRVLDTRIPDEPIDGTRRVDLQLDKIPFPFDEGPNAQEIHGVFLNVTAVLPVAPGHLTVYPGTGDGDGSTSRVNFVPGRAQANLVFTTIQDGKVDIVTSTATQVLVDVVAVTRHPDQIVPIRDFRLLETRTGPTNRTTDGRMQATGRLSPGVPIEVPVTGRVGSITPTAVLLNVTGINPSSTTHVTVFPCGGPVPNASNVNIPTGKVIPNSVLVPIGSGGRICAVSPISTDLVIDLVGAMTVKPVGVYNTTCLTSSPTVFDTIVGGTPPYTVTSQLPPDWEIVANAGTFYVATPPEPPAAWSGYLTVKDSAGKTVRMGAGVNPFLAIPPRPPC